MSSKQKESKYERVEKVSVDKDGSNVVKEIGEDRGKEDPGMNYQDKRPAALVPGAPAGKVPFARHDDFDNVSQRSETESIHSRSSGYVEPSLQRNGGGEFSSSSSSSTTTRSAVSGGPIAGSAAYTESRSQNLPADQLNQRTVVTETRVIENAQRTVPIQPHNEIREQHEVIRHESHSRAPETTTVTIPVTRFESATMESTRHGRTFTEDRELTIPAPVVAPQIHAMQQVNFSGGTSAEIHATTDVRMATEAEIKDMGPEEYARYRAKVEALARQHEQQTSQKAAEYRNEVERDAELIRQTLERQHIRDIEFRKDMVEASVDRQQVTARNNKTTFSSLPKPGYRLIYWLLCLPSYNAPLIKVLYWAKLRLIVLINEQKLKICIKIK